MKQATPCKIWGRFMRALDNGGRFFNFLPRSGDGEIAQSEISKAILISGEADQCLAFLSVIHWRLICHGSSVAHGSSDGKNARSIAVFICRKHSNLLIQAEC